MESINTSCNNVLANKVVKELGGVTALAKLMALSQSAVSHWLVRGVPKNYMVRNKLAELLEKKLVNPDRLIKELRDG
tara:strand:- start:95 stop:325 length:231 start_codon:yes stop_codon:yes gene_type:complete